MQSLVHPLRSESQGEPAQSAGAIRSRLSSLAISRQLSAISQSKLVPSLTRLSIRS
jgi:hypothetical protein